VGLIKITKSERRGEETRVEFVCGRRALADYQAKNSLVMGLAREFTVSYREVPDLVHRLADELKDVRRELRQTRDELLDAEASVLWHEAVTIHGVQVVRANLPRRAPDDLKHLAQRLIVQPKTAVLLAAGEAGQPGYFTFARSADLDVNMGMLVRQACEIVGGRGGGRPEFAQGGGPQGDRVAQGLSEASETLEGLINHGSRDRS
jgi:alanyl-tRNA synthetase